MNPNIPRKRVVKADTTEASNKKKSFKDERFIAPRQLLLQQGYAPSLDQGPGSLLELSKAVDFLHTNHLATIPPSVSMVDYPKRVGVGADGVIIQKNVPAFLNKLYNMVSEENSKHLITWSASGNAFIVTKQDDFAREVLPRFFKHQNFASFVRQLNMYGFHKVPHLQHGSMLPPENGNEHLEFANQHFKRDQPDLLYLVTRKKSRENPTSSPVCTMPSAASVGLLDGEAINKESTPPNQSMVGSGGGGGVGTVDLPHVLRELASVRKHQMAISEDLRALLRDNRALWSEVMQARERYDRNTETINKILKFLASVFAAKATTSSAAAAAAASAAAAGLAGVVGSGASMGAMGAMGGVGTDKKRSSTELLGRGRRLLLGSTPSSSNVELPTSGFHPHGTNKSFVIDEPQHEKSTFLPNSPSGISTTFDFSQLDPSVLTELGLSEYFNSTGGGGASTAAGLGETFDFLSANASSSDQLLLPPGFSASSSLQELIDQPVRDNSPRLVMEEEEDRIRPFEQDLQLEDVLLSPIIEKSPTPSSSSATAPQKTATLTTTTAAAAAATAATTTPKRSAEQLQEEIDKLHYTIESISQALGLSNEEREALMRETPILLSTTTPHAETTTTPTPAPNSTSNTSPNNDTHPANIE